MPPTLRALLAARLDQLEDRSGGCSSGARSRASVPPRRRAGARPGGAAGHAAPGRPGAAGADPPRQGAVRWRGRLPLPPPADPGRRLRRPSESIRAELHERFAGWLDSDGGELVELDEIVGYHLEQAAATRGAEIGEPDIRRTRGERLHGGAARSRSTMRPPGRAAAGALLARPAATTMPARPRRSLSPRRREPPGSPRTPPSGAREPVTRRARHCCPWPSTTASFRAGLVAELEGLLLDSAAEPSIWRITWAWPWYALGYGVANFRGRAED